MAANNINIRSRDRLPDSVKYGTSREINVNIIQKYRIPDIGNSSFGPQTQIIFNQNMEIIIF